MRTLENTTAGQPRMVAALHQADQIRIAFSGTSHAPEQRQVTVSRQHLLDSWVHFFASSKLYHAEVADAWQEWRVHGLGRGLGPRVR
jgi:hypothetical protein